MNMVSRIDSSAQGAKEQGVIHGSCGYVIERNKADVLVAPVQDLSYQESSISEKEMKPTQRNYTSQFVNGGPEKRVTHHS
jgi:hypothetical protein